MSGEFIVNPTDNFRKSMFHIKKILKERQELTIISGVSGSFVATRVCEDLARLNYVTFGNITTTTTLNNERRRINLNIVLLKTKDFDRLYEESEQKRQEIITEKDKFKNQEQVYEKK
jgi:hypothetical protein